MTWYIILSLVGWILTLNFHELSHVVTLKAYKVEITAYIPWPHYNDSKWWFGCMSYKNAGVTPKIQRLSNIMPLLKSLFFMALWGGLGVLWHPLWVLGGWEATDFGNWM